MIPYTKIKIYSKVICFVLYLLVVIINIYFWISNNYLKYALILRPIFLIFYTNYATSVIIKFLRVFWSCIRYFALMWIFLFIFSSVGMKLYGDLKTISSSDNIFLSLKEAIFGLMLLQTTANHPDVTLPFLD
jgi:hypothetical protein